MPPKKAKKKPPKPHISSTSSNDKNPTKPSAAAKKKELTDGKKTEIKQLQDSLSSFFTPTGSRRSRHPPVEVKTVPESSIERSHSPGENVDDESSPEPLSPKPGPSKESPPKKVSSSPKPGPSRVFQCQKVSSSPKPGPSRICDSPPREEPEPGTTIITYRTGGNEPPRVIIRKGKPIAKSSSSPEPCSSKTTAAELAAKKSKRKAIQLRKPGNLPRGYKAGKASSSSSEDDGCGDGSDHPTRFMPNPSYYYKGYYFRECPNAPQEPDQATPIQLIETLKSMEEINRLNPDYREYEVDSDTEYEPEPDPDPSEFDSWNEYLVEKCKPKKMVKVIDGMTRPQRREHRQFALEFKDLIDALKDNHMAYCDGTLRKFSKPFDPPEGWNGRTSEQILQQAKARMEAALNRSGANVQFISDPTTARDPNPDNSPSSSPSSSSSSSSEDSDDDESDNELVNFRQKFSEMDLKPLINMKGMNWRELLPPKPPKEGEDEVSSESSVTTDSDDDPKPLQWEVAGTEPQTRPPEWERYRSTNERVIYRRYIRRACRNILKSNKRKKKIHKFLQIGTFAPPRPIPEPPTRIPEAIVDDDELMEIPNYMGIRDILNGADPEQRSLLIKAFNETHRMDVRRIKEYDKAAAEGPVPKFIYISKYQMKTLYTSPLPFHLRIKDELFLCDQCLDGWIERDTYERHTKVCQMKRPPGKMVYKDEENRFAFFEVDALIYPSYCQMLCCLGISYIEHKSLHTDIEPFLFYVLAKKEKERDFYHFIGYFSKQKYGHSSCNLCCLLVLPCYQGKGYGRYIIDFSFLLSRVEKIPGTPERPLSEAADYLYYRYYYESFLEMVFSWWQCNERDGIDSEKQSFNLGIIEQWTGICKRDMLKVLHSEGMVDVVRFPEDPTKQPKLKFNIDQQELIEHMEKQIAKKNRYWIKKAYLNWKPDFGTIEERMHFPLIQEEYEAREAGLLFQNLPADGEEEEDEEPESPPKPAKKGRKKKGEKKVAKPKKKKMVVRFLHGDTNEEFDAKNPFEDLTRSQVFTNKDFLYQTLPYTRPLKKQKKRPTTTGKRRKPKKKKEIETKKKGEEEESEEEKDIPNLFTDPDDDDEEDVAADAVAQASETIAEEAEAEEEEPQPCSSKTPIKPAPKTKAKKTVAKKKSPPKRRGRKPSGAAGSSCKDKSPKRKKPESSDEDSDDEDGPGPSRRPTRPRGRKRTTTPKTKKAESEAQSSEVAAAEAPGSSSVMTDLPKSSISPLKQTLKASSDEEDSEGHQMVINVREDSSESDDDDSRPLPLQKPHEYHVFSPPLDEAFQMSPTTSPRRSQKRSSRNRSVSFSRNPKESRTSSDYDESNIPPPQPITTTTTSPSRTLAVIDNNVLKMEFGNESVNIYQNQQQPQQENVQHHHHLQHQQQQLFPYSTNNRSNATSAAEKPGKEETEMPKLLPTALEVPIQRMEINDNGERNNVDDDDDDDVDDDAPPMLSPNFATANTNHSPLDEAGEFTPPNLHNNSSNEQPPPMMEAPPMLQNTSSIPKVESVPSHRAPESLQNSESRRSSTEMQQQSHSVPSQSMNLQQHQQMPLQQQIQQQQAWQLQNEMYNSQAAPQQQISQQLIHEQQPRSHPQQMTPQQPASMAMSDPNSVYSMHSVQSQPSTMPPHLPPPPPPQQQQQPQQMHYPPLQQEARKSLEQQQLTHPQQLLQQQLQQQMLQPLPQPEPPKPKPKPKKKKKESTSSAPTSASFSNPMFPQQKYPNPYDAAFGGFFPPSYMAAAQMAQFQGHGGYANYPNPYSSTMPTPTNYQNQQFNTFNAWAGNSTPGYPGYPPFMPQTAGAAAVAAVAQQQQSSKLYSQFRGNAIAAMGGASSSGAGGASGASGAGPSSAGIPQNPNANLFPTNAAAAAAAAQWNPMSQNPPPPNPYNLPPYSYFPQ